MSDFNAPSGPPPPRDLPAGWKAIWNAQYSEWFYVNTYTKQSQWDKPTAPAIDPNAPQAPSGPPPSKSANQAVTSDAPPSYNAGSNAPANAGADIKRPLSSNNPYGSNTRESDEEMARRLQEQENTRHTSAGPGHGTSTDRGQSDSYYSDPHSYPNAPNYNQQQGQQYGQQQYGQQSQQTMSPGGEASRGKSGGGFLSKLKDKMGASQGGQRPMGAPMMGYNAGGYPQQQQGYGGGYPQQGYGGYPQQGYGGYPQQGYAGGYGQQPMMMQQKKKGGLGAGGAAALGVGGGLLGGMLLMDGIEDMQENAYDQGFDDGGDMGGDF